MVGKKGLIRILEAVIAVLIVLGALLVLSSREQVKTTRDLSEMLPPYLEEIARNISFRNEIIQNYNLSEEYDSDNNERIIINLEDFLKDKISNRAYNYSIRICGFDELCPLEPFPLKVEEVFSSERIISTTIDEPDFRPKKVKIFLWRLF